MKKFSKYIYNAETLLYEKHEESSSARLFKVLGFVAVVVGLVCLYFWLYTSVFGEWGQSSVIAISFSASCMALWTETSKARPFG